MDLKKNICDTIKECEIKIGYREDDMNLYYPEESLLELLQTDREHLKQELSRFCKETCRDLGAVRIIETDEPGRYHVHIPRSGVKYIHENIGENPFLTAFLETVHKPGKKMEDILCVFRKFSEQIKIEQLDGQNWGVYFQDPEIDPYVYYLEEDKFGLQYHRFTRQTYDLLTSEHLPESK